MVKMLDLLRIVTVTYNSSAVIGRFLQSVPKGVEVVVVDNASSDETVAIVKEKNARLIKLKENLGFGTGCNRGAEGNSRPYVYFVNPDSIVNEDGCLRMLETAQAIPNLGAMNPAILDEKGRIRLNRRSPLIPRTLWTDRALAQATEAHQQVHILSGAALFCRQDAFDAIGGFDERIFLYHEDDDLCFRLRAAGFPLFLEHRAKVMHIGGASSGSGLRGTYFKAYHIAQSRMYVERKHALRWPTSRSALRVFSKVLSPANLVKRKRTQTAGFLKGTLDFDMARYGIHQ